MLTALAFALPSGGSAAAATPVASDFYGINMPVVYAWPSSRWDPHLRAVGATRAGLVRSDAAWWTAEPNPPQNGVHTYSWSQFDQWITAMARRGVRWYPLMAFSTPWSGVIAGNDKSAPRNTAEYAAYVKAFALRYGRNGQFWRENPTLPRLPVTSYEIWNEENTHFFWNPQTGAADRYTDLFVAAQSVLKAVDGQARVVVGGLSNVPTETRDTAFLRRMYEYRPDLRGKVDAVAFHPYSVGIRGVYSEIRRMRTQLNQLGQSQVPLDITEVGWTSTRTPEQDRADDLVRLVRELPRSDCNIAKLIPYSWVTREEDRSNDEDWFGIANLDGTPKPSGAAFGRAVREMTSSPPAGRVSICGTGAGASDHASSGRKRLRLRIKVRGSLARGLRIKARCSHPCRLRVELVSRRHGHRTRRLAVKRFRRAAKRRRARIRGGARLLRAARGRVRLKFRAAGGASRTIVVRRVRRR